MINITSAWSLSHMYTHTHTHRADTRAREEGVPDGVRSGLRHHPFLAEGPPRDHGDQEICTAVLGVPVQLQGRAFPGRKVTICASSPFPGLNALSLGHLQHLQAFQSPSLPPDGGKAQSFPFPCGPDLQSLKLSSW